MTRAACWNLGATVGSILTGVLAFGLAREQGVGAAAAIRPSPPPRGVAARPASPAIPDRHQGPAASAEDAGRVEELAAVVSALRAEVAHLRGEVARVTAAQEPTAEQRRKADRLPAIPPDRQEQLARLERGFTDEPRNGAWATQAMDALTAALAVDETIRAQVRSVDCRSTTCRVELAAETAGEVPQVMPELLLELGTAFPSMRAGATAGPEGPSTVLFLSTQRPEAPRDQPRR